MNKILRTFCGMPECIAAQPTFFHAVGPEMLKLRLDDSAAQSTWQYIGQVLCFNHQEYRPCMKLSSSTKQSLLKDVQCMVLFSYSLIVKQWRL